MRGHSAVRPEGEGEKSVEALLAQVLEGSPDAIMLLDREWRIRYANGTARRISRIEADRASRETLWELYPGLLGTPLERSFREVVELGEPRQAEPFYYEPFDTWFDIRILPADGGLSVYYRDITELHAAQAAQTAVSEQLQQVFEATTDAVVSLDREFRITFMNRRARELLAAGGEAVGATLWEKFPGTVYEGSPYVTHYNRAMHDGIAGEFEAFYPEPFNFWLHISARPSRDGIIISFAM
jgi:PAS domain-containing protein